MSALLGIIGELGKWIDRLRKESEQTEEILGEVSKSFREAVLETEIYLGALSREATRDIALEQELARKWFEAARQLKRHARVNSQAEAESLSVICDSFAFYWANPTTDPREEIASISHRTKTTFEDGREYSGLLIMCPSGKHE